MTVAASPRPVLGVDACPRGWVGVSLRDGRFAGAQVGSSLQGLAAAAGAAVVGIDMPLGLVDSGWREADFAVRTLLGRRSSSVFVMPPRRVFEESDQAAASAVCKAMTGKGISVQAW
ncbi:MAG: DUF429 domain-containing protein, partial [Mycobacteriaceae bacterium]|nr:DUF429 domain-containing protein [Mycobacteriaceae bacterium]